MSTGIYCVWVSLFFEWNIVYPPLTEQYHIRPVHIRPDFHLYIIYCFNNILFML